jgi:hypothetical protein
MVFDTGCNSRQGPETLNIFFHVRIIVMVCPVDTAPTIKQTGVSPPLGVAEDGLCQRNGM